MEDEIQKIIEGKTELAEIFPECLAYIGGFSTIEELRKYKEKYYEEDLKTIMENQNGTF